MKRVLLFIICLTFISCEKDPIEKGVESNIQGMVYDKTNSLPIENLKLKVGEYRSHPGYISISYEFIQWIDSTYTDASGFYDLDFETSGQGDHYKLHVEEPIDIWTFLFNPYEIKKIGNKNYKDWNFLHLYPINLVINLNNLDFTPIQIKVKHFSDLHDIENTDGIIERLLYTSMHADTEITFHRKNENGEYESYTIIIPASNTSDLVTYNINIENSDFD